MAVAMIGPKFYAWDRNGKPLAFGKLYTYQARTNTPKPTYRSEDQQVENTNPVILNGEGYANVYLDGSYKMVLKDDKENEIWSSDPVTAAQAEEWINCQNAVYVSSTSFKLSGNFVNEYEPGKRVRLDSNSANYAYSTIESSVFAGGETTVNVIDPVVTTGLVQSCTSIVGPESRGNDGVISFDTLDDAVNFKILRDGDAVNIKERTEGNGGGGIWDVVESSTVTPNGFNIVTASDPTLALVLRIDGDVKVKQFGAKGDGSSDDILSIQAAINYSYDNGDVLFESGTYLVSEPVRFERGTKIKGNGTVLVKKTTHNSGGRLDIDCALYIGVPDLTGNPFLGKGMIQGMSFEGISDTDKNDYVIYIDKINQWQFEKFDVRYGETGVYCNNGWLCGLTNIDILNCGKGLNWRSGTSFTGRNIWCRECDTNGFMFYNTSYSALIGCGSDNLGNFGTSFAEAYWFDSGCEFTLTGCSCEGVLGVRLRVDFAYITVIGWDDFLCKSSTNVNRGAIETTGSSARLVLIGCKFNDYAEGTDQLNVKATNPSKWTVIESLLPTNGNDFPGTTTSYGVRIEDGEIKPLKQAGNASVQFGNSGKATISNGQTIPHGLGVIPKSISLVGSGNYTNVGVVGIDNTNITVGMRRTDDNQLITTPEDVYWSVTYDAS